MVARAAVYALITPLVILVMAGLPLLVSAEIGGFAFDPMAVPRAALVFIQSAMDGSVFTYKAGFTEWDFRLLGPKFLLVSFLYTALPGAVGIGLGTFAGVAYRRRRRGFMDRLSDFALATPDFLVIFAVQIAASWIVDAAGFPVAFGGTDGKIAALPFAMMSVFPFFISYRSAAEASRRVGGEEFITYARAKGLPERLIVRRHIGAALIPGLEAELPVIIAFMQGSLFIVEKSFSIPGMAKLFFDSAFAGRRKLLMRAIYQYNHVVISLLGLAISCVAVYAFLRLALALARKALTRE